MKSLIVINAYPNDDYKISLLEQQLFYFKQLKLKIMVVSGCDVPEKLRGQIDYLIINTDNIKIGPDHTYKCFSELKLGDTAFLSMDFNGRYYGIYGDHVNITIVKNIKLAFTMADMLEYKSVFYTEDDNIFKEGSFEFIKKTLNEINEGSYNLIGCKDYFADTDCIWTTYFFTNIKFFLEKFTIPDTIEEYYNDNNILDYKLQKPLEASFYEVMKRDLNLFKDIKHEILSLKSLSYIDDAKHSRGTSKTWVINNIIHIIPDEFKNKYIICHNPSMVLKTEQERNEFKSLKIDLTFNDMFKTQQILNPHESYICAIAPDVKTIKVCVHGFFEKEYSVDYDVIKYDGILL